MKPAVLLLLGTMLLLAPPARAVDPTTMTANTGATLSRPSLTTTETTSRHPSRIARFFSHLPLLQTLVGKWTRKPGGEDADIIQYQGLSSRPWASLSADPPYMSDDQDLRVHHPNFGILGN